MRAAVLSALMAHWRRHPLHLASLLLGLALATALWSGVQAINMQARDSYDRAAGLLGQDRLAQLVPVAGDHLPQARYVALRRAGWQLSPVLEGDWRAGEHPVRILGIDPLSAPSGTAPEGVAGAADLGLFIGQPGLGYAAPDTLRRIGEARGLPPLRPAEGVLPGLVIVDIGVAQHLLGQEGQLSRLVVLEDQPQGLIPLADLAPDLALRPPDSGADLARLTDSFHLNLTAFGLLSFAVGLFITHSAVGLAFEQRRPVLRTLRALGAPLRVLVAMMAGEMLILALVAGVVGVALGYGLAAALLPDVAATLRGLYGAPVAGALTLKPAWWLGGLAIAVAGAGLASGQSLWRLARLPLLAPAQPRAWARAAARGYWLQGAVAAGLAAVAVGLGLYGRGLLAGFALLGALLLAAALVLPGLLTVCLAAASRLSRGALAQWFWADSRQQLPGLSLALMALLLALATNIGVGTMVGSFRATFTGWLDQRLVAELYVTARTEDEATRLRAFLAGRAEAVLPVWSVERTVLGAPVEIYGVADHPTYRAHWPILSALPGAWDRLAAGEGVLVNEQLARRAGLAPGDSLPLPGGPRQVVGIYSDYGNPRGQVMVSVADLLRIDPQVPRLRHAVRVAPDQAAALAREIARAFGLPPQNIRAQAEVKALSLSIFERTFAVTAALNVLTMAVAGLALFFALLTLAAMRLPQLAPVWALGLTRARLARLELLRAVLLSGLVMALALPVGLMLAWALLAVVNVAAFGWRLPMAMFPADWARMAVLALTCGALAAAWPAWRLARLSPTALLKVFANER